MYLSAVCAFEIISIEHQIKYGNKLFSKCKVCIQAGKIHISNLISL